MTGIWAMECFTQLCKGLSGVTWSDRNIAILVEHAKGKQYYRLYWNLFKSDWDKGNK